MPIGPSTLAHGAGRALRATTRALGYVALFVIGGILSVIVPTALIDLVREISIALKPIFRILRDQLARGVAFTRGYLRVFWFSPRR